MSLSVEAVTGPALKDVLPDLARLRIAVFRDWPYLYDGSEDYEREYLAKFIAGKNDKLGSAGQLEIVRKLVS